MANSKLLKKILVVPPQPETLLVAIITCIQSTLNSCLNYLSNPLKHRIGYLGRNQNQSHAKVTCKLQCSFLPGLAMCQSFAVEWTGSSGELCLLTLRGASSFLFVSVILFHGSPMTVTCIVNGFNSAVDALRLSNLVLVIWAHEQRQVFLLLCLWDTCSFTALQVWKTDFSRVSTAALRT